MARGPETLWRFGMACGPGTLLVSSEGVRRKRVGNFYETLRRVHTEGRGFEREAVDGCETVAKAGPGVAALTAKRSQKIAGGQGGERSDPP